MKLITGYTGSAHVTGSDDAALNHGLAGEDCIIYGDGLFEYSSLNTTSVTIGVGEALLHGVHCRCLAAEVVELMPGTDGMNRIDYIVIRHIIDPDTMIESAGFAVVNGTETSGNPSAPSLSKSSTSYEMALYQITWTGTSMTGFAKVAPLLMTNTQLKDLIDSNKSAQEKTNTSMNKAISANTTAISELETSDSAKLPLTGGTVTGTVKFNVPPRIYNGEYYVLLKPIDGVTRNCTLYTPNRSSVVVSIPYSSSTASGTAVGGSSRPVYVANTGYVIECSELAANTKLSFETYGAFIQNTANQYIHFHARESDANYGFVYGANRNSVWAITPYSGNSSYKQYLGTSSYKWEAVYATNGAIQTSDRNAKHDIKPLDEKYIELFKKLIPVSFMFNSNSSGRTHVGFISQDVEAAMLEVGLSDLEFAGFCKDVKTEPVFDENGEWMEERPVYDADGNPEYIYSLRYDEFIAIVTRMVQLHEDRLNDIEERLARLEG